MEINKETAELIYKAIKWCNEDWYNALDWELTDEEKTRDLLNDFFRFCDDHGIQCVVVR